MLEQFVCVKFWSSVYSQLVIWHKYRLLLHVWALYIIVTVWYLFVTFITSIKHQFYGHCICLWNKINVKV